MDERTKTETYIRKMNTFAIGSLPVHFSVAKLFTFRWQYTAVEIKSDSDNLKRLEEQILEYKKIFDYVLIVATEKHINKICEVTSSSIGVYVIKNNLVINKIHSPHIQRNKDKTEMLYSINAKYLCKLNHYNLRKYNADEVRYLYKKRRISNIQEILNISLKGYRS